MRDKIKDIWIIWDKISMIHYSNPLQIEQLEARTIMYSIPWTSLNADNQTDTINN